MTRINVIDVFDLTDQHVMAEYRELPMIIGSLKRTLNSKHGVKYSRIPNQYTLNKGHVCFFYNKKQFLINRYQQLIDSLVDRKYQIKPNQRNVDWSVFDRVHCIQWTPTNDDKKLNFSRIKQRLLTKTQWYRYYSNSITNEFITNLTSKYEDI